MPVVPRYNSPQVQPQDLPNVRHNTDAPIEAFGGGQSRQNLLNTSNKIADSMYDMAKKEKEKADDTAVQEAYAKTVKLKNDLFYNPEKGVVTRQGKDSFGVFDEYGDMYDNGTQGIEDELLNEQQKSQYRLVKTKLRNDLDSDLNRHVFTETKKYEEETFKATIDATTDDAILNYHDPDRVRSSLALQQSSIIDYARKNDKGSEWAMEAIKEARSKTQKEIINRMLGNGDDISAEQYFEANKHSIDPSDLGDLEKSLEEGSLRGKSQRVSDDIVSKSNTLGEAIQATRNKKLEPKLRDEVDKRNEHYFTAQKAAMDEQKEIANIEITQLAESSKNIDEVQRNPKWKFLSVHEKNAIENRIKDALAGTPKSDDRKILDELSTMARTNRLKFISTDLTSPKYTTGLTDGTFKRFELMKLELKQKGVSKNFDGFVSDEKLIESTLKQAKLDIHNKDKSEQIKALRVRDSINLAVSKFKIDNQREPTPAELQSIAKKYAVEVITERGFFKNTEKRYDELEERDQAIIDEIVAALERNGVPVTDENVNEMYNGAKGEDSGD